MNFYDNLTDSGVFFFWIVVFIIFILFGLSVFLLFKNKKLKELVEKDEEDKESELIPIHNSNMINNKIEEVTDVVEENINIFEEEKDIEPKLEIREEVTNPKINVKEEKTKIEISTPGAYQRNVLREMSRKMPISPIHIEKSSIDEDTSIYTVSNDEDDYDLDEIYLREDSVSPLEEMEDSYEVNDNMKFASEIVSKMEEEMKPSNIELTDYEKKQEEEAIISYDELQKVKDKIYNITEDEETDDFIDELKIFRSDLK